MEVVVNVGEPMYTKKTTRKFAYLSIICNFETTSLR